MPALPTLPADDIARAGVEACRAGQDLAPTPAQIAQGRSRPCPYIWLCLADNSVCPTCPHDFMKLHYILPDQSICAACQIGVYLQCSHSRISVTIPCPRPLPMPNRKPTSRASGSLRMIIAEK